MEERMAAKAAKQKEDMAEYEESRREEREKEAAEIAALREKRIQRAKEREEEEKKLAALRVQEEAKRKAEKEEREQKKREAEERLSKKGPNFVITKRTDGEKAGPKLDSVMTKEELQKSKEQLEEEKRAILSQRIQPLAIDGLDSAKLQEKAKELHEHLRRLVGDKYDLEQRFKRQQYDMIELAERARQMNKGKKKGAAVQVDDSFDRLSDKFTSAPPKIQLCSKYERHTDHRTYADRMHHFEELAKEPPAPEIQHVGGGEEAEGEEE